MKKMSKVITTNRKQRNANRVGADGKGRYTAVCQVSIFPSYPFFFYFFNPFFVILFIDNYETKIPLYIIPYSN